MLLVIQQDAKYDTNQFHLSLYNLKLRYYY